MKLLAILFLLSATLLSTTYANFDSNNLSYLSQIYNYQTSKLKLLADPERVINAMTDLYDRLTHSDRYKAKLRATHEKYGSLRSGEGTPAEIRRRVMEE